MSRMIWDSWQLCMMLYDASFPSLTTCGSVSSGCVSSYDWVGLHFPLLRAFHVILSPLHLCDSTSQISDKVIDAIGRNNI